jgi:hypothetical protein
MMVNVHMEAELFAVEGLGAIHIRDGKQHKFEFPIHDAFSF